ncbi:MAG: hypothetical protein AB8C13_09365 [Phycisphaerales bacterium]
MPITTVMSHDSKVQSRCRALLVGAALAVFAGSSQGWQSKDVQDGGKITRPAFSGRVVRAFDFEEQYSNPLPVPRGWIRAQHDPEVPRDRPSFPIWNGAKLDYASPAFSGTGTVMLPTLGGSTSLILRHGELTVFPNADYLISARVRTDGLKHARARMVATIIDRAGNDIPGSRVSSGLAQTRGEWELLSISIDGTGPDAAFVRLELELLQPEEQPRSRRLKPFTVWSQDYTGAAWFDDVVIAQVPMIGLSTGTPGNMVASDESPSLKMSVRDLTGDDLSSYVRVFDASGHLVDEHGSGSGRGADRLVMDWTPELSGFGWYSAVLDVLSGGTLVGRKELSFIWQPPLDQKLNLFGESEGPRSSVFGIRSTTKEPKLLEALPEMVRLTGVHKAEIRALDIDSQESDLVKGSELVNSIDRIIGLGVEVGLSLGQVPMDLADQAAIDHDAIFSLLLDHEDIVLPALGPFMDRYGQRVSDWRLGVEAIEDDGPTLATEINAISSLMDPYVPGPVIGLSWAMDRPFEQSLFGSAVRLLVEDDPSYPDEALTDMISQWVSARDAQMSQLSGLGSAPTGTNDQSSRGRLSVVHRGQVTQGGGRVASVWSQVGWLGRRAINAWWASRLIDPGNSDTEILLSDPWVVEQGSRGRVLPGPELLLWRTLVDHLGGRQAVQEIDLEPGVRMLLCSGRAATNNQGRGEGIEPTDGVLVMWLDEPSLERAVVELPLSMGAVEIVDLFGNIDQVMLESVSELGLPMHKIEVTRTPMIVTGVNAALVQFLSNVKITPNRLEATGGVHKHQLQIMNPWPFSIRGRVYIVEPGGYSVPGSTRVDRSWEIKPRVVNFTVSGNQQEMVDLDLTYSAAQLSGMRDLIFDIELQADQDYGLVRVQRQIELGTDAIDVDLSFRRVGTSAIGGRIEVVAVVANRTDQPMLADVIALAPKNPRQESTISSIEPLLNGERSFVFEELESGDEVIVSVRIPGLGVQINKSIRLP